MTEELKILLEMVNKTTEMGLVAFVSYLIYLLVLTGMKFGIPCLVLLKIIDRVFTDENKKDR